MSRRERIAAVVAGAVVALFLADRYLLAPMLRAYGDVHGRRERLSGELAQAEILLKRRRVLSVRWRQMLDDGLCDDPAEAESRVLHAVGDWARQAGLRLTSVKPQRSQTEEGKLREIAFHASGTGNMAAVSRFLWLLETAALPIKVDSMQLGTRKSGQDDLTMQLRCSTIYLGETDPAPDRQRPGGAS